MPVRRAKLHAQTNAAARDRVNHGVVVVAAVHPIERAVVHRLHSVLDGQMSSLSDFVEQVESAVQRITLHPASGTPYLLESRRMGIQRFPYSVVYVQRRNEVVVLAVAHDRRKPAYWQSGG